MQLALLKSQCALSHTHFLLPKPTVNETLTLGNVFVPQSPAAVTRLLPPNPNFPCTAYCRLQNPTTLLTLSLPSWITSIIGKTSETPRLRGLLKATELGSWIRRGSRLVQCPRTDIVDKVWTNLLQWEGRRVVVELQGLNAERPRETIRAPSFSSNCLSHSEFASLPLWCR
jgi:hypothetical protein